MIPSHLTVENPDELLSTNAFGAGALVRIESSATGGGIGFTEIGTVALVAGTTFYTYYDQTASTNTYYRSRYSNAGNTNRSDYGAEWQGTAISAGYCSLYDVKQRLGIAATDTTNDEDFLQFIDQVTGWISSRTARQFSPDPLTGTTQYLYDGSDATDYRCLLIPTGIRSIATLEIATYTGGTFATCPASDYFLRPAIQNRDPGWPATEVWLTDIPSAGNPVPAFFPGYANVRITGAFGWASTPSEIEDIALTAVVSAWRSRSAAGGETVTIGTSGERTIERALTYEQRKTLERYRMNLPVVI